MRLFTTFAVILFLTFAASAEAGRRHRACGACSGGSCGPSGCQAALTPEPAPGKPQTTLGALPDAPEGYSRVLVPNGASPPSGGCQGGQCAVQGQGGGRRRR